MKILRHFPHDVSDFHVHSSDTDIFHEDFTPLHPMEGQRVRGFIRCCMDSSDSGRMCQGPEVWGGVLLLHGLAWDKGV